MNMFNLYAKINSVGSIRIYSTSWLQTNYCGLSPPSSVHTAICYQIPQVT